MAPPCIFYPLLVCLVPLCLIFPIISPWYLIHLRRNPPFCLWTLPFCLWHIRIFAWDRVLTSKNYGSHCMPLGWSSNNLPPSFCLTNRTSFPNVFFRRSMGKSRQIHGKIHVFMRKTSDFSDFPMDFPSFSSCFTVFPMVSPFCSTVSQGMRHQQLFLRALPGLVVGDHGGGMEASPGLEMSRDFFAKWW